MDDIPRHLFSTNIPPTDLQSDDIRRLITELQQDVLDTDRQYPIAQLTFSHIAARQRQRQRDIAALTVVLSPVRQIPRELLVEIFQFCSTNSRLSKRYSIDNPRGAPLVLSRVCSFWRDVAVNTPRLWTRLSLDFPRERPQWTVSLLPELIRRSYPHSLIVKIRSGSPHYMIRTALNILRTTTTLPALRDRVEGLSIKLPPQYFECLKTLPIPTFPSLRTLYLHLRITRPSLGSFRAAAVIEFFRRSEHLRKLELHSESVFYVPLDFAPHFPWQQLTNLNISTTFPVFAARAILIRCTSLICCIFPQLSSSRPLSETHPACTLLQLQKLTLMYQSASTVAEAGSSALLRLFAFPNLRHLDIDIIDWPDDTLISFQDRSGFTLTYLSLRNIRLDATAITRFLERNPTIEELHLREFRDQGIIQALTYHPSRSLVLLPHLTKLWIVLQFSDVAEGGEDLVEMLESRWLPPNTAPSFSMLQQVHLHISGPLLGHEVEAAIERMASVGFLIDHVPRE